MNKRFNYYTEVKIWEADEKGFAKLSSIFNYLQQASIMHAHIIGAGLFYLMQQNLTWVLSSIKLEIVSFPLWEEKLTVETSCRGLNRIYYIRDFVIKNASGQTLVNATSEWLLLNTINRRPQRPELVPLDNFFTQDLMKIEKIEPKYKELPYSVSCKRHLVQWSDLDVNNHVNNARYVDWVVDCLRDNNIDTSKICSFQMHFINELKHDEIISLNFFKRDNLNCIGFLKENQIFQSKIILN
ncbi:MAG: hypothetical protein IPO21_00580 [Bacteroidales bacterium]|nr:hypothetical protein [Bacteroidales bacterium]